MNLPSSFKLAVVVSHPIQYYSPWFRWMAQHTSLEFRVFYLSDVGLAPAHDEKFGRSFAWDVDLTSGYAWEIVPNQSRQPDTLRFKGLDNPELFSRVRAWGAQAVLLFGYNYRTHLRFIRQARRARLPLVFRGDSHLIGRDSLPWLKRWLLRRLYARFAAVTYVGQANRDYFRACGVPETRLFFAPHAVDESRFDPTRVPAADRVTQRQELGFSPTERLFLFAGKLIPQKQPDALLRAFLDLRMYTVGLVFVGDGPLKSSLEKSARQNPGAHVRFLPFANQSEMPGRYAMADVFVLPSKGHYETWGLAVQEAMHLGVPCVVSDKVGCQRDLVTEGETGWVFAADDPASLGHALQRAAQTSPEKLQMLGRAARERVSHYTYRETTAGLLAALDLATPRRPAL